MNSNHLILASQSPRRKDFLKQLGFSFTNDAADIDESRINNEAAVDYVTRLALEKAKKIAKNQPDTTIVLGSDTCVAIKDEILGKPDNREHYEQHMKMLSGGLHHVYTAVAAVQGSKEKVILVKTDVVFKTLSKEEIAFYWQTGEAVDKAGSYGIQGIAGQFVKEVHGSYSSVVGLPLVETSDLLKEFGLQPSFQSTGVDS